MSDPGALAVDANAPTDRASELQRTTDTLLSVRSLLVEYRSRWGTVRAVDGLDFQVGRGETLGIIGETGSGKTTAGLSLLGLLGTRAARIEGEVRFDGIDLLQLTRRQLREFRGRRIGMIFQNPVSTLNPTMRVGDQIAEALHLHNRGLPGRDIRGRVLELLGLVGLMPPETRARQYPHELSGGMCQRVVIAMAIANSPDLIIADEPTTALDVSTQSQILALLRRVQATVHAGLILISHDLRLIAELADRVLVMYAGRPAEIATVDRLFHAPRHPYSLALLASRPSGSRRSRLSTISGQLPGIGQMTAGCAFAPRCQFAQARCRSDRPPLRLVGLDHLSACHFAEQLTDLQITLSHSQEPTI